MTVLQMVSSWSFGHRRWASGHRDAVRVVPRYPPGRGSSYVRTSMGCPPRAMCARLARGASSLSDFLRKDCRPLIYAVILYLLTLKRMPDQSLSCSTISISVTMSSMVLVTNVPSSAYYFLASRRPQDVMLYPFCEALSHRMRGSIMRSNNSGERGAP